MSKAARGIDWIGKLLLYPTTYHSQKEVDIEKVVDHKDKCRRQMINDSLYIHSTNETYTTANTNNDRRRLSTALAEYVAMSRAMHCAVSRQDGSI